MSKLFFPVNLSIGLTGQQCEGFQGEFTGSSAGTSGSNSGTSSSNGKQASVGLANKTGGNAPAALVRAGAIVVKTRSIRTSRPYFPKKENSFKTWSNMNMQLVEDKSKSKDDGQLATEENTL